MSADSALDWLLEPENPGVRYLALRDLVGISAQDSELRAARRMAHQAGPIAEILSKMEAEGYWVKPGAGYNPKYFSTVWSLTALAQLGAWMQEDERIARACAYLLEQAFCAGGQFAYNGSPGGTIDCLQGNLCYALTELGLEDARLDKAYDWMARTVTGEGIAPLQEKKASPRYYAFKCGPAFACGINNKLPCAWGAAKVMLAFSRLAQQRRSALIQRAIQHGVAFLLSVDPADAAYPTATGEKPNASWWKFGFPLFYITDVLQIVEVLAGLGCGGDPRLQPALNQVRTKQDLQGRWLLEYDYAGKTWGDYGPKKQPNKWVTLRALRALNLAGVK
jgi:hypothetical protein